MGTVYGINRMDGFLVEVHADHGQAEADHCTLETSTGVEHYFTLWAGVSPYADSLYVVDILYPNGKGWTIGVFTTWREAAMAAGNADFIMPEQESRIRPIDLET